MNRGAEIASSSNLRSRALEYMCTKRSGSLNGNPRKNRSLIKLKIAVFKPIPSASVAMAMNVNAGDCRSLRNAKRTSFIGMRGLFGPQRLNGIDKCRSSRRQQAGDTCSRGKHDDRSPEQRRICRLTVKEFH